MHEVPIEQTASELLGTLHGAHLQCVPPLPPPEFSGCNQFITNKSLNINPFQPAGVQIHPATKQDAGAIALLFRDTIQTVNATDYPADEIADWSSWWTALDKWQERIEEQFFIKAVVENQIVGFASLAPDGYLDYMFTHKDYQGCGIAAQLLKQLEKKAMEQGLDLIYSDVSITAKGFFERHGYEVEKQQFKKSKNKALINFRMTKAMHGSKL
jgi:GNAT superfamily N-acetyltransferase